jgi:solute carrier family 6 amino acid/orphan transporter-like 15/16/17/18/20
MNKEEASWFPANDLRDFHGIVPHEPTPWERKLFGFREDGSEGIFWVTKPGHVGDEEDGDDHLT